jgi:hypothetical protein
MSEILTFDTEVMAFGHKLKPQAMLKIEEIFKSKRDTASDINEHMETLRRYASECEHITEMGVRSVVSTWAFLAGNPKKYIGIDINPCPIEEAMQLATECGIDFKFMIADTVNPDLEIEETDLLFIDTWHIYKQLKVELELHNDKARKYIIMHDTTSFGYEDEGDNPISHTFSKLVGREDEKKGLFTAIEEFLATNDKWYIKEKFAHNNGVTVLARK